ncbi:hypothetical protein V6N12_041711 [Hibiscus sabdariffa]|uniref:Cyclin C-terminal domain-containing protein n=1 Tax=Hibiscus sabdariffa TaxID=183260 RepID=A0ABR2A6S6_9ROSI
MKLVRFEDGEVEESYRRLRERERRQVYLHDYAEEYRYTTDYGDLILLQRSFMIRWIIECAAKEFSHWNQHVQQKRSGSHGMAGDGAKADADVEKSAKYLAVLALSDHEQLRYWPSTVAAGVVTMASKDRNQHGVIEIHMRTKDNELLECMKSLDWLVQYIR